MGNKKTVNNKKTHYNLDAVNGMPIFSVVVAAAVTVISILAKFLLQGEFAYLYDSTDMGKPVVKITEMFPEVDMLLIYALVGLMIGFSQFSFLSSRPRFYMQMSLGIKRKKLFMNRAWGGLILLFICCFAPAIADIIINASKFGMSTKLLFSVFALFFSKLSACTVPFLFALLSSLTCSRRFEKYALGVILTFTPRMALKLLFNAVSLGMKGINTIEAVGLDLNKIFSKADPILSTYSLLGESYLTELKHIYEKSPDFSGEWWSVFTRILWVAFALIYLFVLCSEFSEDSYFEKYIFGGRAPFATALFSAGVTIIPVSLIFVFASETFKRFFVYLVVIVAIGVVFTLLPSSKKERILKLSVCIGVAFVFSASVFAGKSVKLKVPSSNEIKFASVFLPETMFNDNLRGNTKFLLGEQYEFDCVRVEFSSATDMEYLTQLLKALETEADNENGKYIQIEYSLNNGKYVSRKYRISSQKIYDVLFEYYATDSFSEHIKEIIEGSSEYVVLIDSYEQRTTLNSKSNKEQIQMLKSVAVDEFLALSPAERFKPDEKPLYILGFEDAFYGMPSSEITAIPVYEKMEQTVRLIDSLKVKRNAPAKIKKLSVYKSSDIYKSALNALDYDPELHSGHGILFAPCDLITFNLVYRDRDSYDIFVCRSKVKVERRDESVERSIQLSGEPIKEFYGNEAKKAFENCFSMYYCPGECEFAVAELSDGRNMVYYFAS